MKYKYIYTGQEKIFLAGFGIINPGDIIETEKEIKNKNFNILKEKKDLKKVKN